MAMKVHVEVVSAEGTVFSGQIEHLTTVTAAQGQIGIWFRHTLLLATLKPGMLRLLLDKKTEQVIFVHSGLLKVMPHIVTILADTVTRRDEFESAAAARANEDGQRQNFHFDAELEL